VLDSNRCYSPPPAAAAAAAAAMSMHRVVRFDELFDDKNLK